MAPDPSDGLSVLLPSVAAWFRTTFGAPTPPQRMGWPQVAAGVNTLIFAPTGSGKTLAAFLAAMDHLWRVPRASEGVRILYVSPLKALNNDIYRNLQAPLHGIVESARESGRPLPLLTVGLRTGDTPASERRRLVRTPPDILITTPESLHLLLTSKAAETLRSVSHVIVDEIHAVCANKRGVFLALLLERLRGISTRPGGFLRIGLSATQRPLEEVAAYLGGRESTPEGPVPRPVAIVDAGGRKDLDLEVTVPCANGFPTEAGEVWPAIEAKLLRLIESHESTIVFANNRRVVERLAGRLNEGIEEGEPPIARPHHGSLNLAERRATEEALKHGELKAVVSTASLEMGIDMGAVDLVCQVESPGSVARGLQRVGRAGHVVGRASKGRLIAKTPLDLLESAALCRGMLRGEVESLRVPTNCLDVLAQQVVSAVAAGSWSVPALFDLVRRAHPYRDLTADAFESVLAMISGRFPVGSFQDLRARVTWDRVHNLLHPLPGTSRLALGGGGTIPDTGQYPLHLGEDGPKLGELDEEFVLERTVGDTFSLGASTWRIESIDALRVVVSRAEGQAALTPFWRGEGTARSPELGRAVGLVAREIAEGRDDPGFVARLKAECRLDDAAASALFGFVSRQLRVSGVVPDDRTVLVETFRDQAGEIGLAVLTPFGAKLHSGLRLALQGRLRERLGVAVSCFHADEGLLIRVPRSAEPPLDLFDGLDAATAERLIRSELGDSALFGLRFRQNAGRALLMPKPDPAKRTPLWLQRLRAKDLLQVVRKFPDFPVVVETYRECLDDDLDLPNLKSFLDRVQRQEIRVAVRAGEIPSPFASSLIFRFTNHYLYRWDEPTRGDRPPDVEPVDVALLDSLLEPAAIGRVEARLRGYGRGPRTADEAAEVLRGVGDLADRELAGPMAGFLEELRAAGRAIRIELNGASDPFRWISAEEADLYRLAFGPDPDEAAAARIVARYLRSHALVGLDDVVARYGIDAGRGSELLERWVLAGEAVRVAAVEADAAARWASPENLAEVRRQSVAIRRRESVAVRPETYADFLIRRLGAHPGRPEAPENSLDRLVGLGAELSAWESEILPRRIKDFRPERLDGILSDSGWIWSARGEGKGEPKVAFFPRDFLGRIAPEETGELSNEESSILTRMREGGAEYVADLARKTATVPSILRTTLDALARRGLLTNDRLDPLRPEARRIDESLAAAASGARPRRSGLNRRSGRGEGRWSALPPRDAGEEGLLAWIDVLLDRHGVLAREMLTREVWSPPWRELQPLLARAELRGEIRRGYFVEGLSGVQYATEAAAAELAALAARTGGDGPPVLLSTVDPANVYGSGAPFDVPLLEGGTARLSRTPSNSLVLIGGRPVLIIEGMGKRLTGLASASEEDLRAAASLLPGLAGPARRVLKVETYNEAPALASPAAPWLSAAGFVRSPPGFAFYAGWS